MFVYQRVDAPIPKGTSCSGVFSAKKRGSWSCRHVFFALLDCCIAAAQSIPKNRDGNLNALWFFDWCKNDCCWKHLRPWHTMTMSWILIRLISSIMLVLQTACSLPVFDNGVYRRHIKFWSDDDDGDEVWGFGLPYFHTNPNIAFTYSNPKARVFCWVLNPTTHWPSTFLTNSQDYCWWFDSYALLWAMW